MARAQAMGKAGDLGREKYAADRVKALGRDLEPTVTGCGRVAHDMRCGCVGVWASRRPSREERCVRFTCKQHLMCERCNKKRSHKLRCKMAASLAHHLEQERTAWRLGGCARGGRPAIVLLTLTIQHSGDVAQDRRDLADGWREFYKRLHRRGWAKPYCGAWEATSGRDGLGHVHLHIGIVWPFVDWSAVIRLWKASCRRPASIDLAGRRKDGRPSTGASAAKYIGKYVGKGADVAAMGEELAADIVAATYNQRTVITSRKFWMPWERPCCEGCGVVPWPDVPFRKMSAAELAEARALFRKQFLDDIDLRLRGEAPEQLAMPGFEAECFEPGTHTH